MKIAYEKPITEVYNYSLVDILTISDPGFELDKKTPAVNGPESFLD